MACLNCCCECFVLVSGVSELSSEFGPDSGGFGSPVLLGFPKFSSSVESWNADSVLSWSKNFERWWRKSKVPIHDRSYRKFFFNFLDWTATHQVSSSSEHTDLKRKNFK